MLKGTIPNFKNEYKENILHGADPVLDENNILVPVKIDDTGNVTKANTKEEWYNYEEKRWANTIIKQNSYDALIASGSVKGATKNNGYVEFDGVNDYIDLGLKSYDFGNTTSIAIRLKINEQSINNYAYLIGGSESSGMNLLLKEDKHIQFQIWRGTKYEVLDSDPLTIGTNYTIIGTYDGYEMKLYIDGEKVASQNLSTTIKPKLSFSIGADTNTDNHNHYSNIDVYQAAIFDRALTEEEIKKGFTDEIKIYDGKDLLKYVDFTEREEEAGEVIPEDIIESYFVWIPKFKYKIFDKQLGKYTSSTNIEDKSKQAIEIEFGLTNTKDDEETNPDDKECATPMLANQVQGASESNGNCKEGMWMTHPAFLAFNTTGLWIGKFTVGYKGASSVSGAQKNENNNEKIIIKPNVYSWRGISLGNAYKTSLAYKTELQSHMMKNTEWGAIAYLTQSIYGRCESKTNCTKISSNSNANYMTGYVDSATSYFQNSILASTTGNYSGVYDVNGSSFNFMASFMYNNGNATLNFSSTGLNKEDLKEEKYYDVYNYNASATDYSKRILGDATGEIGPFLGSASTAKSSMYEEVARVAISTTPIWYRSAIASTGSKGGIFAFNCYGNGSSNSRDGYRLVLAPKN